MATGHDDVRADELARPEGVRIGRQQLHRDPPSPVRPAPWPAPHGPYGGKRMLRAPRCSVAVRRKPPGVALSSGSERVVVSRSFRNGQANEWKRAPPGTMIGEWPPG
jgi:hypothetical protein